MTKKELIIEINEILGYEATEIYRLRSIGALILDEWNKINKGKNDE